MRYTTKIRKHILLVLKSSVTTHLLQYLITLRPVSQSDNSPSIPVFVNLETAKTWRRGAQSLQGFGESTYALNTRKNITAPEVATFITSTKMSVSEAFKAALAILFNQVLQMHTDADFINKIKIH
jgi:hypothetical protein